MNINRLSEALRMIEDLCRFEIKEKKLSDEVKKMRHELDLFRRNFRTELILSRDSESDTGRKKSYDINSRHTIEDIAGSSFGRSQESCRVLEEFAKKEKHFNPFKEIRYKLYDLEKIVITRLTRKKFSGEKGLYVIMTEPKVGYEKLAEICVKLKVKAMQLRDKKMEGRALLGTAKRIADISKNSGTLFIVNDRIDVALLSGADGVHLGQTDVPASEARRISKDIIVGKSTHNLSQLKKAMKEKPDYVGIGPLFPTNSKAVKDRVLGVEKAGRLLMNSDVPAVAIGGINNLNIENVMTKGFFSIAVLSYIGQSENPKSTIESLMKIIRRKS